MNYITTFYGYERDALALTEYPAEQGLVYTALGLAGEAGEYANKVKKLIRDHNGELDIPKVHELLKELGDVLWYVTTCAEELGSNLKTVANMNLDKLQSRKRRNQIKGSGDNR